MSESKCRCLECQVHKFQKPWQLICMGLHDATMWFVHLILNELADYVQIMADRMRAIRAGIQER